MSEEGRTAFAPGHVTGFFTVDRADDPMEAGSRGGGIALDDGVEVRVSPAAERSVYLDDVSVDIAAVEAVLDALQATVEVRAQTPLPLGAGFGVSGAIALATALATNATLGRGLSADELTALAHGAEVQAGTGLGDVVAQARGGVPLRLEPGAPRYNQLDAIPSSARTVEYLSLGERSTPDVLEAKADVISTAGRRALSTVVEEPTLPTFMRASRKFARETELLTTEIREVILDVTESGGTATMAMLGETVIAMDQGLSDAGYAEATTTSIRPCGAVLED